MTKRIRQMAKMPTHPGWYRAGYDHLRYFNGNEWTELTRPLPDFIPIVDGNDSDRFGVAMETPPNHFRRYFALILLAVLILGIIAPVAGI